jgi:cytochrome c-type biogenesis protein CcmE
MRKNTRVVLIKIFCLFASTISSLYPLSVTIAETLFLTATNVKTAQALEIIFSGTITVTGAATFGKTSGTTYTIHGIPQTSSAVSSLYIDQNGVLTKQSITSSPALFRDDYLIFKKKNKKKRGGSIEEKDIFSHNKEKYLVKKLEKKIKKIKLTQKKKDLYE